MNRSDPRTDYARYLKPALFRRLDAAGLAVEYHRAVGDFLFTRDETGAEVEVLDLVGGFGSTLLGHNHTEVLARLATFRQEQRPFHAQGSVRGEAGVLARRLSERVARVTGRDYTVILASSGAEAIEAALRHAELEREAKVSRLLDRTREAHQAMLLGLTRNAAPIGKEMRDRVAAHFGPERLDSPGAMVDRITRNLTELLTHPPVFLAVEGSFHGKTTGAGRLTHNPRFRSSWRHLGPSVEFLRPESADAVRDAVERAAVPALALELSDDGSVAVREFRFVNVGACFVEPILGEGGVRPLSADYLQALRSAADEGGFPLVIDEIQTGMGRTGTFLASQQAGVRADYYTLGKSLGGGAAKISALLIDRERAHEDFDLLHTSTYADDDFSSAAANAALDLLERDDDALINRCRTVGEYMLDRLGRLHADYPDQIAEVRGRGLMVGVEFAPQSESPSALLRVLDEQGELAPFLCGHLLAAERIRVLPTLSAPSTLRIQPSAFIGTSDIDRLCGALGRMLLALRQGDAHLLCRHLVGGAAAEAGAPRGSSATARSAPPVRMRQRADGRTRVAFLGHFIHPEDLCAWDARLVPFNRDECARFVERSGSALRPFVAGSSEFRSTTGDVVELAIIGIPFTSEQALAALRSGRDERHVALVRSGVALARELGCSVVGCGGYTSILTRDCRDLVAPDLAITSGNALTAAAGLEALRLAAARLGLRGRRTGIVGAAGNIGRMLAELVAEEVSEIVLVGRPQAESRLERVAEGLLAQSWQRARAGETGGIAGAVASTRAFRTFGEARPPDREALSRAAAELGDRPPVRVHTGMAALAGCDLILTATNAARPVIGPEHVACDRPVVLCDLALPRDVDPAVSRERPLALVLKGGMVRAPLGQALDLPGLVQADGELYGCVAEALLLGLAGVRDHGSWGPLSAAQLRRARELARTHGFLIEERPA